MALRCSAVELHPQMMVGRDRVELPQLKRGVYNALGSPMPSLPGTGSRGGTCTHDLRLMRPTSCYCSTLLLLWRKAKESNPRPCGRPGFQDRLRATAHHLPYTHEDSNLDRAPIWYLQGITLRLYR